MLKLTINQVIVNFEHISHLVLVFLLFEHVIAVWELRLSGWELSLSETKNRLNTMIFYRIEKFI